jgi:hypothetical protein
VISVNKFYFGILALLLVCLTAPVLAKYSGGTDLTGDGWVDLEDLAAFADNWLQ